MIKSWNWPPWLQLKADQSRNSGLTLVGLVVALAIGSLAFAVLVSMSRTQLQNYQATVEHSEAFQSAWIALSWLKRDLQSARSIKVSVNKRQVTLEVPCISRYDLNEVKWRTIQYYFQRENAQLLRNIGGSFNIVAEGIVTFTISTDQDKRTAVITVASMEGSKQVRLNTKVWLRNVR